MIIFRPGTEPTHDDPQGGRRWHYLTGDGKKLEPAAYLYEHHLGGWGGEAETYIFPDGYDPAGPATREQVTARVEETLVDFGYTILDQPPASNEPRWFLLIAGIDYYPSQDTGDWGRTYATREEALTVLAALRSPDSRFEWGTIVDLRAWVFPRPE